MLLASSDDGSFSPRRIRAAIASTNTEAALSRRLMKRKASEVAKMSRRGHSHGTRPKRVHPLPEAQGGRPTFTSRAQRALPNLMGYRNWPSNSAGKGRRASRAARPSEANSRLPANRPSSSCIVDDYKEHSSRVAGGVRLSGTNRIAATSKGWQDHIIMPAGKGASRLLRILCVIVSPCPMALQSPDQGRCTGLGDRARPRGAGMSMQEHGAI
jgi:hypothetical protein